MSEAQESRETIPLQFHLHGVGCFAQHPYDVWPKVDVDVNLHSKQISDLFIVTLLLGV